MPFRAAGPRLRRVSDIHLRPITRADAAAVAEVVAAAEAVDRTEEHFNTADLLEEMANPMIDLATDWAVAEVDGRVVGHSELTPRAVVDGTVRIGIEGVVHPEHRRRGIGTALLDRMAARARAYAEERGARAVLVGTAPSDVPDVETLFARHGMSPRRWQFVMTVDLAPVADPPPELPPGYALATWEGLDSEEIRRAHNRAFVDHPGWTPWSAEMWDQWVTSARSTRPELSLVARDEGGAIAAYVQSAEYDAVQEATGIREAFVGKVGTVPEHRRRGLADVLLRTALHRYRAAGYERAALDVDSENPTGALGLYERAGFRTERRWTNYSSAG